MNKNVLPLLLKKIVHTPLQELPRKAISGFHHYVLEYPSYIVVQTVSACNLKCTHCFLNLYGKEIKDGTIRIMPLKDFEIIINKINKAILHAKYIQFSTFEAFLHKHFFKMMDLVLEINPQIEFPIITSGTLVDDNVLSKLRKYPISGFTISLDGTQKQTVEGFKIGASFEKIISSIKDIVSLNKAPVAAVFVLHKGNVDELYDYVDFVNDLGVKKILVNNLFSYTGALKDRYLYTKTGNQRVEDIFQHIIKRAIENGQELWLPSMEPKMMGCTQCEELLIDMNGNVVPCDYLAVSIPFEFLGEIKENDPVVFGNVLQKDVLEIYRSETFRSFRQKHRRGKNLPDPCNYCIDAYGLLCSHRTQYGKN